MANYLNYRNTTVLEEAIYPGTKVATFDQNPLILNVNVGESSCLTRPSVFFPSDLLKQGMMTLGGQKPAPIYVGKTCPPIRKYC